MYCLQVFLFIPRCRKRHRKEGYLWPIRCTYGKDNIRTVVLHSAGQDQQEKRSSRVYTSDNQRITRRCLDQALHRAARLERGKRKSQRKKPRRKGFEPVPGRHFRQHSADSKGPRTRQERGLRPNHSEPLSGQGAIDYPHCTGQTVRSLAEIS